MKRYGNLYEKIISIENLTLAHKNARKGKTKYTEVKMVDKNVDYHIKVLHEMLRNDLYKTSDYEIFKLVDKGKEREIFKLPYYPDRIVHWAIMQIIEPIFLEVFINQTYAAIPNKGTHEAFKQLDKYLVEREQKSGKMIKLNDKTQYCLKIDIKKFFPNIDKAILKNMMRKKIKDSKLLHLLDEIIDSVNEGVPIGNYLSQYWGNFYLSYFDHWLKEEKGIKYYLRYMDDCVILHHNKDFLHQLKRDIDEYLENNLKLKVKENWQVFPTFIRGVDFVGFRHFGEYALLRKSTAKALKIKMRKLLKKCENGKELTYSEWCSINSYKGWTMHCDGYNLTKKYIHPLNKYEREYYLKYIKKGKSGIKRSEIRRFSEISKMKTKHSKAKIEDVLNKEIIITRFWISESKFKEEDVVRINFKMDGCKYFLYTYSKVIIRQLNESKEHLPFITTVIKENKYYKLT